MIWVVAGAEELLIVVTIIVPVQRDLVNALVVSGVGPQLALSHYAVLLTA